MRINDLLAQASKDTRIADPSEMVSHINGHEEDAS